MEMNVQKPSISIIVPVYKVENYLGRCVKSILAQTFTDFELILVDDGSPDNCPKMCDEWAKKDSRIKVIHKKNGGASAARNAGLNISQGNYIGFVDSDDWIVPDMYECLLTLLKKHHADIAFCNFSSKEYKLDKDKRNYTTKTYSTSQIMPLFFRVHGEKSNYSIWNRLYKKEIIGNIRFKEGIITEDVLFCYETYKKADLVVSTDARKYYYFPNSFGVTQSKLSEKDLGLFKIWDEIIEKEKNTPYFEWAILNRKRATFTLYVKSLLYGYDSTISKATLKCWKNELKENYKTLIQGEFFSPTRKILYYLIKHL